ncbi:helix-turn-helix domain-containing protein [Bradyrhizobium sp. C9]|uniref:helix-turn-helix domain-containing protein n=1 Tax=Bradyrhizobium sp. C9 TaxID=142585 RepID=UPI000BE943EA|nr:helix-turn-helix domain-containing protein [Bradyrhizobium sp. C9]PDT76303.1 AraC family transcriptional regulator [Bradyrhizobium sp. C9]
MLDTRLTSAHRLLTDRLWDERSISSIAFEAGFGDLPCFNRTFRRRYGATPSEIRAAARR